VFRKIERGPAAASVLAGHAQMKMMTQQYINSSTLKNAKEMLIGKDWSKDYRNIFHGSFN
jgi:hypothetical protein